MTTIRLALGGPSSAIARALSARGHVHGDKPSLLVSTVYTGQFDRQRHAWDFREWVLDSGAFSVWKSGKTIDHGAFLDEAAKRLASDPQLVEVFALDVIGDPEASERNVEEAWRQGVPVTPCYHVGEPVELLRRYAATYPRIALSASSMMHAGNRKKAAFVAACATEVWPKVMHGFALTSLPIMSAAPMTTVDASSWQSAPMRFGNWKTRPGMRMNGHANADLTDEVDYYLDRERAMRTLWRDRLVEARSNEAEFWASWSTRGVYQRGPLAGGTTT